MVSRFFPPPVTVNLSEWPAAAARALVVAAALPFWLLGATVGLVVVVVAVMARGAVLGYRDVVSRWAS